MLTDCDMDVFDDGLQVFFQRSHLQLLDVFVSLRLLGGIAGQLRIGVFYAAVERSPVQLSQELFQIFKRVFPIHRHRRVRILRILVVMMEALTARGGNGGVGSEAPTTGAPDRLPLSI